MSKQLHNLLRPQPLLQLSGIYCSIFLVEKLGVSQVNLTAYNNRSTQGI